MKIKLLLIIILLTISASDIYPCNSCGGGTGDIVVLALDGRALINLGLSFDHYNGTWNSNGTWINSDYSFNQYKTTLSAAYRINRHLQFGLSVPYVFNKNDVPGWKNSGSGLGDITLSGRYELFHEFQLRKKAGRSYIDRTLPYLAVTFGLTVPTGRSDEKAKNDADITGKGFYSASIGVSLTKSIIKGKLQLITDLNYQHSFTKTYESVYGEPLTTSYKKSVGGKFNYGLSLNYIINNEHAVTFSANGFSQGEYRINDESSTNSSERSTSIALAYTYYPTLLFRITPSVKYNLPANNLGKNATGSTTFNLNLTYYFSDFNIK